ncbi:predicted protein [Sclerotinia sclerotiorum 1980 UF-70]|uniref:Uncharacterized protein n=2 Tax=Sclerotinia sclerotiorum (strain ATCC 18683 / 1980 / Ss-1) TaxID=665079 RepID=A7ESY8_SCLS1|nr:predicted protein [Sclerotinia sclerotiorum 1980 UF-70]APA12956.1 hypothetical protein sscle_10g077260 [Sclerotinia sclerotiorum 1980 UF-70]EDN92580.1 predicted protein [Sclerotinia sclerotiorum 1980 UF-70]
MSQESEEEREGVESGEVELSLFARQNEDALHKISHYLSNKRRKPCDDSNVLPKHMGPNKWALGKNLSQIQSISVPSRIIPGINIIPAHPAVPLPEYLHKWHQDHEETFPFQNLTHSIVEDPLCSMSMSLMHRLSEPGYCAYIRQAVEEFFQEENRRHPEFRIPMVIIVPQRTRPTPCRDCIGQAIRVEVGIQGQ